MDEYVKVRPTSAADQNEIKPHPNQTAPPLCCRQDVDLLEVDIDCPICPGGDSRAVLAPSHFIRISESDISHH